MQQGLIWNMEVRMIYIILSIMFALIISIEYFMFKLDKKVNKLTERIYEIEVNRSIEL